MKRKSLGVILNNFGVAQNSFFFVNKANELLEKNHDVDVTGFFANLSSLCVSPNFALMQLIEAYSFRGTLIATDLDSAIKLIGFPGPAKKYFYVWDLEFMRMNPRPQYEMLTQIYRHPALEIVARSESHKKVLENNFNLKNIKVSEDFNLSVFLA